jgi:hypothetical protein
MIAFETDVRINHPIEEVFAYVSDPLNASSRSWRAKRPREFAIRTTAGPTPFLYRYRFSAEKGETSLKLDAEVELPGTAALLRPIARRLVKKGVDENLATLKQILEADRR